MQRPRLPFGEYQFREWVPGHRFYLAHGKVPFEEVFSFRALFEKFAGIFCTLLLLSIPLALLGMGKSIEGWMPSLGSPGGVLAFLLPVAGGLTLLSQINRLSAWAAYARRPDVEADGDRGLLTLHGVDGTREIAASEIHSLILRDIYSTGKGTRIRLQGELLVQLVSGEEVALYQGPGENRNVDGTISVAAALSQLLGLSASTRHEKGLLVAEDEPIVLLGDEERMRLQRLEQERVLRGL